MVSIRIFSILFVVFVLCGCKVETKSPWEKLRSVAINTAIINANMEVRSACIDGKLISNENLSQNVKTNNPEIYIEVTERDESSCKLSAKFHGSWKNGPIESQKRTIATVLPLTEDEKTRLGFGKKKK